MPRVLIRVSPTPLPFIYKLIRAGKLTAYKVGDRTIILPEDAEKLLRAEPIGRAETPQTQESPNPSPPAIEMAAAPATGVATPLAESGTSKGDSVVVGKVSNGNPA